MAGGKPVFKATGGTISYSGGYKIHTFLNSGTFQITDLGPIPDIEYLVVGGGGLGHSQYFVLSGYYAGGGGGGGKVLIGTFVPSITSYAITVGRGGYYNGTYTPDTCDGLASSISVVSISAGGGYGQPGRQGGQSPSGYSRGGYYDSTFYDGGGGGAGAGGNGGSASSSSSGTAGNGGAGVASAISGTSLYYGGGGGGGVCHSSSIAPNYAPGVGGSSVGGTGSDKISGTNGAGTTPAAAPANRGGGGGGGAGIEHTFVGGAGGSGVVILRYLMS
jgi:hypothetical protein